MVRDRSVLAGTHALLLGELLTGCAINATAIRKYLAKYNKASRDEKVELANAALERYPKGFAPVPREVYY